MTVKDIVLEYLTKNGYGGLRFDECGCFLDDLIPCGESCEHCEPAYSVLRHCETCDAACDIRFDGGITAEFCLTTKKPDNNGNTPKA